MSVDWEKNKKKKKKRKTRTVLKSMGSMGDLMSFQNNLSMQCNTMREWPPFK